MTKRIIPVHWLVAGTVAFIALGVTLAGWSIADQNIQENAHRRFNNLTEEVTGQIVTRMAFYEQVLRGGIGLFYSSEVVSREEWRNYVEQLGLEERFPGVQGIGFSLRVPRDQKDEHIAAIRAEGFPDYAIRPDGEREEYHSIIYLEPFSGRNLRAFGYDMFSEPSRRAAMERARDSGRPALSSKVTLVQESETKVQAGFLLYLPLYAKGLPRNTMSERQKSLVGFVYCPFRMDDLMGTVLDYKDEQVHLKIYDGKENDPANMLFDSAPTARAAILGKDPELTVTRDIVINGEPWHLEFASRPLFEDAIDRHLPIILLVGGSVISVLLFLVMLFQGSTRRRAVTMAKIMTEALQVSEERTRNIVDTAHDGIITIDAKGTIQTVNPAVERIFGYHETKMLGRNVKMLMPEPYMAEHDQYLSNYMETGEAKIIGLGREVRGLRSNGTTFALELAVNEVATGGQRIFVGVLRDISERTAAEDLVQKANEKLTQSVATLERRDRELTLLTRMNDLLMACKTRDEAFGIIRMSLEQMFKGLSGALAVQSDDRAGFKTVIQWGESLAVRNSFGIDDCWAVRQGRIHDVPEIESGLICGHITEAPYAGFVCMPLMVQNTMLGVLTVEVWGSDKETRDTQHRVIASIGETIKMSLSNLDLREALREQAIRDPLTKLYNRRFMEETLAHEEARALRQNLTLSIAVVDIDFFKKINDTYGHDAGDRVLREMGQLLLDGLRASDIPCRFGGEEFVVILPETAIEDAVPHFNAIRERFEQLEIKHGGRSLGTITLSVGLAAIPSHGKDCASVMLAADKALYAAKEGGRNRVVAAPSK